MVPFKAYYTGEKYLLTRARSRCRSVFALWTIDIIGTTQRHNTFFENAGNFSFGDYFKEGAITYAWQLVTEDFGLDPELCG